MSAAPCTKHPQQGFALLEALITLVIASILGLGLAYALARASAAQRIMNGQNMAVTQMRYKMQVATSSNCSASASSTISIASTTIAATCSYSGSNYTVTANNSSGVTLASGTVTINAPSISTSASDTNGSQYLGGQMTMTP